MYLEMLDILMDEETKDLDIEPLVNAIETMASKDYWPSKNERLQQLLVSEEVAKILVKETVGFQIPIQELTAILAFQISKQVTTEQAIRNATDVIESCNGLIYNIKLGKEIMIESHYQLEDETYKYISLKKYEPPLKCKPRNWQANDDGGYHQNPIHSMLGSHLNQHDEKQALDVLNKLQSIAYELDPYMLQFEEEPNKEFKSPDSHEQFKLMKEKSKEVYEEYKDIPFYFLVQFDKRGRQYTRGYHINIQSSSYKKSIINFHNKQLITEDIT